MTSLNVALEFRFRGKVVSNEGEAPIFASKIFNSVDHIQLKMQKKNSVD